MYEGASVITVFIFNFTFNYLISPTTDPKVKL